MAASVFGLGLSAFLPIIGIKFDWVPIHWISGVILTAAVLYHILRVAFVHGLREMVPVWDDCRELAGQLAFREAEGLGPAKYDAFQKGFHLAAAVSVLALVATGLLMLAKIDTAFWKRNPAILSDMIWGVVYVVHGIAAMAVVFLVIIHVYFGILPEHRAFLISMIRGRGPKLARSLRR